MTLDELEKLLQREDDWDSIIEILPNGEIREKGASTDKERGDRKPLTMRENLGGEYAA
jgi:hypothetical protein